MTPSTPKTPDSLVGDPARLAAVQLSGLLDAPAEQAFDSITRLASAVLRVPASFITLVDAQRDFYLSEAGFPEPLASARELGGRTFCHYTLDREAPLVIEDTHAEAHWRAVPTVESLGVRAYVGVPLKFEGQNIGSLCAIDMQPRTWSADEIAVMEQLALSVAREIAVRRALGVAREEGERARELARKREEIVAVVAHDLRTPLQILHLSHAVLQRKPQDEAGAKLLSRMSGAVKAIGDMADNLLADAATGGPLTDTRQPIAAAQLASDAVEMMGPIAQRSQVELVTGALDPAGVVVNYSQVLRVFGNVIGNAIKFSPLGGRVTVGAHVDGASVVFTVSDEGPGIGEQAQAKAFEAGWQGDAGLMHGGGSGLGLSIVRRLVEEHGGRAWIEALPGRGTRVSFSLPMAASPNVPA